jgi:hypothetical protein
MPALAFLKNKKDEHPFVHLRDPAEALAMLSRCGDPSNTSLCALCTKQGQSSCPYLGVRKIGHCPAYILDEDDLPLLETRYTSALMGLSH